MPFVQVNDLLIGKLQAGPPAFKLVIWYQKLRTFLVNCSFRNADNPAQINCAFDAVSISDFLLLSDTYYVWQLTRLYQYNKSALGQNT